MRPPAVPLIKMNSPQNVSSDPSISVAAKLLSNHRLHPLFLSRYHMTSELGAGGFGFVLGGAEITSNKPVAVKFIIKSRVLPSNWVHDDQVGAIPLEVYLLRHCAHKNVIAFLDLYVDEKFVYLVTELHGSQWHSAKNTLDLTACADHSPQVPLQHILKLKVCILIQPTCYIRTHRILPWFPQKMKESLLIIWTKWNLPN